MYIRDYQIHSTYNEIYHVYKNIDHSLSLSVGEVYSLETHFHDNRSQIGIHIWLKR